MTCLYHKAQPCALLLYSPTVFLSVHFSPSLSLSHTLYTEQEVVCGSEHICRDKHRESRAFPEMHTHRKEDV